MRGDSAVLEGLVQARDGSEAIPPVVARIFSGDSTSPLTREARPSFDDKLIQEVVRLILESIYEPTFSDYSHGFRINRSCCLLYTS